MATQREKELTLQRMSELASETGERRLVANGVLALIGIHNKLVGRN